MAASTGELGLVWNTVFITVHAAAAVVAFVAGALSLSSGRFLAVHLVGIAGMAAALVPAVLVDWATTDVVPRVVFGALLGLAAVMVVRAELAWRCAPALTGGPTTAYVHHVGFALISLADGFAVVSAVRLGVPGWLVGVLAVGVVLAGQAAIAAVERRSVVPAAVPG